MFGIGFMELCIICVVALVFIGPQKLPSLMVDLGKFFVQLRRMSNDVKNTFDDVVSEAEKEIEIKATEKVTNNPIKRSTKETQKVSEDSIPLKNISNNHMSKSSFEVKPETVDS